MVVRITIFWGLLAIAYLCLAVVFWKEEVEAKPNLIKLGRTDLVEFLNRLGKYNAVGFLLAAIAAILSVFV
ncbi:MAG: hypothetical protein ABH950_03170 [Candidatus Altiarchaeota archaeon]